jgi:hypothetical protein
VEKKENKNEHSSRMDEVDVLLNPLVDDNMGRLVEDASPY